MFKPGITYMELPGIGNMQTITLLHHEENAIDLSQLEEHVHPAVCECSIKQSHVWGPKLGLHVLLQPTDGEKIHDLIVRTLKHLGTEHVPANYIVMRSRVKSEPGNELLQHRTDSYYNYHIDVKDSEKVADALRAKK